MQALSFYAIFLIAAAITAADRQEPEFPLRIAVIQPGTDKLVHLADVRVVPETSPGVPLRWGQTGLAGEGFEAEQRLPIDPAYKTLLVIVGKRAGQGTMRVVYDATAKWWAPEYSFRYDQKDKVWKRTRQYAPNAQGEWARLKPITARDRRITPPPMAVMLDRPFAVPVVRSCSCTRRTVMPAQ